MAKLSVGTALTARPLIEYAFARACERRTIEYLDPASFVDIDELSVISPTQGAVALVEGGSVRSDSLGRLRAGRCRIILLVNQDRDPAERRALRLGVDAVVSLTDPLSTLDIALSRLETDQEFVSPGAARAVLTEVRSSNRLRSSAPPIHLTDRERQVLTCLCDGLSTKAIAHNLGIAVKTVEAHRSKIFTRLQVRSRDEAVAKVFNELPDVLGH